MTTGSAQAVAALVAVLSAQDETDDTPTTSEEKA